MSAKIISRSRGKSVVAAAAYRSGCKIRCEREGLTHNYESRQAEHSEIIAPADVPDWVWDRASLWNHVEASEKRKDSQLAREVRVALPIELSKSEQLKLVRGFVQSQFVDRGMVADLTIHRENPNNPHAHIMLTTRKIGPDGFGLKNKSWNDRALYRDWREQWAVHANKALELAGHEVRIDHRSYAEQGIRVKPTKHIGPNRKPDGRERLEEHERILRSNGEAIQKDPTIALEAITHQQAIFTKRDVDRFLKTRTADAQQFQQCRVAVFGSTELVRLGSGDNGQARYTTREMSTIKQNLVSITEHMMRRDGHQVSRSSVDQVAMQTMTGDQIAAFEHITQNTGDVAVLQNCAGKFHVLDAAREAWEHEGLSVKGGALTSKAAESLEVASGIESRTLQAWEYQWAEGQESLGPKDVFVVDEPCLVSSRQMQRIMRHVDQAGAKVVLVGASFDDFMFC